VRLAVAKAYPAFKPHELGRLPLTYYQTLVESISAPVGASSNPKGSGRLDLDEVDDAEKVVEIDIDEMIRQGRVKGAGS